MREHIAARAAGFNARASSMGLFSRLLLISVALVAAILFIALAIPLLIAGAFVLIVLRLWLRLKLWWRGDPTRFRPGQVDDEGRRNVRVRMPEATDP